MCLYIDLPCTITVLLDWLDIRHIIYFIDTACSNFDPSGLLFYNTLLAFLYNMLYCVLLGYLNQV